MKIKEIQKPENVDDLLRFNNEIMIDKINELVKAVNEINRKLYWIVRS